MQSARSGLTFFQRSRDQSIALRLRASGDALVPKLLLLDLDWNHRTPFILDKKHEISTSIRNHASLGIQKQQ